ncbi:hypothetical protein G6F57_013726 [Rhizopus arrhizus]|nr:hypothetical protein G6F24_012655 [Rhizopus arrhizus]KAG1397848.1 hypothetical protein G6F58_011442 [Rhizopus delemar]KAG0905034.1 hypothetical protein G6F33_012484 [Rhizopus arrhizus]KAG0928132.1 hypothetical protein G6F30_012472 [Rhizopus arrhizus]KAG1016499.1 hypothetical protein G6F26_012477 [Rhizopus arrhizus]
MSGFEENMQEVASLKREMSAYTICPLYLREPCNLKDHQVIKNDMHSFESMSQGWVFNSAEAKNIAAHYNKKLVSNLTCMSDNYWFLVTSLDVFIHNNPKVDGCTDQSKIVCQSNPVAYIRRKNRFKLEYFEFSIKINEVESLATGGFWGDLKSSMMKISPFLGSSIPSLPEILTGSVVNPFSREVFTIKPELNIIATVRSNRTIKEHSTNLWAFHNKQHHDNGLFPTNPLFIQSSNVYHEAGSLLLRIYAERKMQVKRLNELLEQTSNKRNSAPKNANFKTIVDLLKFTR